MEVALNTFRSCQRSQNGLATFRIRKATAPRILKAILNPLANFTIDNVEVLRADMFAVGLFEIAQYFPERKFPLRVENVDVKEGFKVLGAQTIVGGLKISKTGGGPEFKRIVISNLMAAHAILADQALDGRLTPNTKFSVTLRHCRFRGGGQKALRIPVIRKGGKLGPPTGIHGFRITQKSLVKILQKTEIVLGDRTRTLKKIFELTHNRILSVQAMCGRFLKKIRLNNYVFVGA